MSELQDPLGDELSCVEYITHMGDDLFVINCGRASHGNRSVKVTPWGERFIELMATHGHWTPFGHPHVTLHLKMPIFIVREWRTHTVGFIRSEESRRDVTSDPDIWLPMQWRVAPSAVERKSHVRSGTAVHEDSVSFSHKVDDLWDDQLSLYREFIDRGVAPELARCHLPQSMYVNFVETASLAAYARLFNLRNADDAQHETRLYALAVGRIIEPLYPVSWRALTHAATNTD